MSGSNFLNILKTITEVIKCPSCGHSYDLDELHFVTKSSDYCLVNLSCNSCKTPVWVNFFTSEKKVEIARDLNFYDMDEISTDELISFHKKLKNFDGNFKKVFNR